MDLNVVVRSSPSGKAVNSDKPLASAIAIALFVVPKSKPTNFFADIYLCSSFRSKPNNSGLRQVGHDGGLNWRSTVKRRCLFIRICDIQQCSFVEVFCN